MRNINIDYFSEDNEIIQRTKRKYVIVSILIITVMLITLIWAPVYFIHRASEKFEKVMCSNQIIEEIQLKNRKRAIQFERNCGATTGYSYHLSIINNEDSLYNKPGNVYRSEVNFHMEWLDNNLIVHEGTSKANKKRTEYKGMQIQYK